MERGETVGPTVLLDILIEGVPMEAVVDTGSQSTIISRDVLHMVGRSLRQQGHSLPKLGKPTVKLYGKGGQKNGHELVVTTQLHVSIRADGKVVSVPILVQPGSKQACLLVMNAAPLLGLSFLRANGLSLRTSSKPELSSTSVRIVRTVTIPS